MSSDVFVVFFAASLFFLQGEKRKWFAKSLFFFLLYHNYQ